MHKKKTAKLTVAGEERLERQHGAAGEREDDHADGDDGQGHELVHVAAHAVAEADGGVADDRLEAVAALGGRRRHGEVGQVVHTRHHADQRRHALRQLSMSRRRRRQRGRRRACRGWVGWDRAAGRTRRRRRGVVERRGVEQLVSPDPRFGRLHGRRRHHGEGEEDGDELAGRH